MSGNFSFSLLYTTTSYPPAIGGAQLHTHQIAQRLASRFRIQVVTLWTENRTDWLLGTTLRAPTTTQSYTLDGVPVAQVTLTPADRRRIWPWVLGYYGLKPLAIQRIAGRFVPKLEPFARQADLIHNLRIGREPLSYASLRVARQRDIPFVFTPYHHPRWVGWNYREYINLYRQADALIALTPAEKRTLVELGVSPERIFVTGNGPNLAETADPARFRRCFNLPAEVPLVLFLGQKYRYKGIEALVGAARLVWQKWPDAHFVFIGPRTRFSRRFFARHTGSQLVEIDTVDLQTKTDALAACTLLCLPSTQESFGGVFTEAWSFGKPVIGADIPAVREVIDDGVNGYVVRPTPADIAEKIDHLLRHPALAARLGQAGQQKTRQEYSWERLAEKTERVYTAVLAGGREDKKTG
ncbi:MAG: glycosyltransferase family 1 protein [Calditrichaeota bacterium]|nr:MAG: glycosyltransferase family 1 protein [Calditrichota bacterium]